LRSTTPAIHGEALFCASSTAARSPPISPSSGSTMICLGPFLAVLDRPNGIVFVTGPTGSGKTTTLYTALTTLNSPDTKILTVEDPIEYVLEGVNQVQIRPQIGLTFANALRSFLRQDPDIMMVGEIRDLETGQISV
jgi:general secretion pathway protein E